MRLFLLLLRRPVPRSMTVFLSSLSLGPIALAQDKRPVEPADTPSTSDASSSGPPTAAPPVAPPPPVEPPSPRAEAGRDGNTSSLQWRVGGRVIASTHPTWGAPNLGGIGAVSLELPWGFRKMMFEIGAGTSSGHSSTSNYDAYFGPRTFTYFILDTQACLLDLPIGNTRLSALGCLRVAGAIFDLQGYVTGGPPTVLAENGLALWTGASARIRWQTPFQFFFEANADAMYGTVSEGEDNKPGWFGIGFGAGLLLYPFDETPP
jgi:hypothetical protein